MVEEVGEWRRCWRVDEEVGEWRRRLESGGGG